MGCGLCVSYCPEDALSLLAAEEAEPPPAPAELFLRRMARAKAGRRSRWVSMAAQAMGGEWNGRKLGTLGDVSFFSLGRGKAIIQNS